VGCHDALSAIRSTPAAKAQLEPADVTGRSGSLTGQPDSYIRHQAIRRVLAGAGLNVQLIRRAEQALSDLRAEVSS